MTLNTPAGPHDAGGPADRYRAFSTGERAEYELLRRQASVRHRRARAAGSSVLLLLALLFAPVAVVATWVQDTVTDTDRYVATVAPLASEPAVQDALTDRLTDRVVAQVDVKAVTDSLADTLREAGVPPRIVDGAESLEAPCETPYGPPPTAPSAPWSPAMSSGRRGRAPISGRTPRWCTCSPVKAGAL